MIHRREFICQSWQIKAHLSIEESGETCLDLGFFFCARLRDQSQADAGGLSVGLVIGSGDISSIPLQVGNKEVKEQLIQELTGRGYGLVTGIYDRAEVINQEEHLYKQERAEGQENIERKRKRQS